MNRRDFLTRVGIAGVSLPALARGTTPCPPPAVSVQGGQTVQTSCGTGTSTGSVPAWWSSLSVGQWAAIASSGTLAAAAPPTAVADSATGQTSIISAWSGATVDQSNRRYIMLANGGHGDYAGNEGYRLDLGSANPGWQRFIDPTPNSSLIYNDSPGVFAVNADGRARSMHTAGFQCYGDGQIWYPYDNSYNSGAGGVCPSMASFNMNNGALLAAISANTPLAWDGTAGPWTIWGVIGDTGSGIDNDGATGAASFGVSVFDRVGHRVFGLGGLGWDRTASYVWYINTQGSSVGKSASFILNNGNPYADFRWAVCAYDLNIIVAADGANQRLVVFNLANVGGSGWYTPLSPSGSGYYGGGVSGPFPGAGYVVANHTIAIGDPPNIGNTIYKLQIPTTVSGGKVVYNPSGAWTWTTATPGGAAITFPNDTKPYTRFNLIENMGDGTAALVYVGGISAPTYVYKIAATGV
jgi:hypothetical protein